MMKVAIVGTGPTGIYSLQQLLATGRQLAVTLFEKGERAGIGMPYSPEHAGKFMLANIASIEIPPVVEPYLDWLQAQPEARLVSFGLEPEDLDDRQFTPRLLLGEYYRAQLLTLVEMAREGGHQIDIQESTEVLDILPHQEVLQVKTAKGWHGPFDRVILATGHDFPGEDEATRSYYPSPWSGLIEASTIAAPHPQDHAGFLSAFTGSPTTDPMQVSLAGGAITVRPGTAPTFVGFDVQVPDLEAVARNLSASGIAFTQQAEEVAVEADVLHGVRLSFACQPTFANVTSTKDAV